MSTVAGILNSSLGKKFVMAGTGVLLFLFVVGHLVGNLQVFGAPESINTYAHFLQSKPLMVWSARIGLLVLVALHITTAVQLSLANQEARPVAYASRGAYGSTWQSRYTLGTGIVIAAFILYHLAHFTALLPGINGVGDFSKLKTVLHGETVPDVYGMMILGFQVWWGRCSISSPRQRCLFTSAMVWGACSRRLACAITFGGRGFNSLPGGRASQFSLATR
jgi:succinate dehydrogenase / fumarate reductase, cytochrome b subunit